MKHRATLKAALGLGAQGYAVHPCSSRKTPTTDHGFYDASKEPEAICRLWAERPGPYIAVATGEISGIDVLDLDLKKHQSAKDWYAANKHRLPATRVHQTGGGGLHFIYRHRPGQRCSIGRLARGVDIKADGGYAIWHPAAAGKVLRDLPLAPFPEWIAEALKPAPVPIRPTNCPRDLRSVAGLVRTAAGAMNGERNAVLHWAACRFGELVRDGEMDEGTAKAILIETAHTTGLIRQDGIRAVERTINSGFRRAGA
jgi:hypothetical protein